VKVEAMRPWRRRWDDGGVFSQQYFWDFWEWAISNIRENDEQMLAILVCKLSWFQTNPVGAESVIFVILPWRGNLLGRVVCSSWCPLSTSKRMLGIGMV
jgi:hypothetical protein